MATISFKFDEVLYARLSALAEQRTGLSPNLLAREIVTEFLEDGERKRLLNEIRELRRHLRHLHEDHLTAVFALLVKAGRIGDPDEARTWIAQNLIGPDSEGGE